MSKYKIYLKDGRVFSTECDNYAAAGTDFVIFFDNDRKEFPNMEVQISNLMCVVLENGKTKEIEKQNYDMETIKKLNKVISE